MTKQYKKSDQVPGMIVTSEGIALSQDRVVDLLNQLPAQM